MTDAVSPWDWLTDTYWYVPTENLLAFVSVPEKQITISIFDQTVFHITKSISGYFYGDTVVQLGSNPRTCLFLMGSVTPQGNVLLTFTPRDVAATTQVTYGTGVMCLVNGQAAMLNQMASGPPQALVSHWAYMLQTREGDASWDSLPGAGVSVPEFLSTCGSSS